MRHMEEVNKEKAGKVRAEWKGRDIDSGTRGGRGEGVGIEKRWYRTQEEKREEDK